MVEQQKGNTFSKDRYGGIEITDLNLLPDTEKDFDEKLTVWIEEWKLDKVRSV